MTTAKMNGKTKPDWAGSDRLSRWVNRLIQIRPFYQIMKQQARRVLIQTAEKNGIPWKQTFQTLASADLAATLNAITHPHLSYPDYYQVPFHAYDQGNLCWEAAFEAESATHAMALRVWPQEDLSWQTASDRLRSRFHEVLRDRLWDSSTNSNLTPNCQSTPSVVGDVLDVGCSVGLSTRSLHQFVTNAQISAHSPEASSEAKPTVTTTGLDLSPYMLAIAQYRTQHDFPDIPIAAWVHGNAEHTPFADQSFDLITLQFVLHELPRQASQAIFQEMWRLLRPGGCLALLDNNPQSPVIQNLPPVLFTLMKSTEPWSDDYYTFDVEAALKTIGFQAVATRPTDPRHRAIVATKPLL